MFVRNIKEFKKKTNKKKIICLDCGKKKVGVAISDENHKISMPMETLFRNVEFFKNKKKQKKFLDKFAARIILEDFFNSNRETNE